MLTYEELMNIINSNPQKTIRIGAVMDIVQQSFWRSTKWENVYRYLWARYGHPCDGLGDWGSGTENELELNMMWIFGNPDADHWEGSNAFISLKEVKKGLANMHLEVITQHGIDMDISVLALNWAREIISSCCIHTIDNESKA